MPKPSKSMRTFTARYAELQLDMPRCLKQTRSWLEQYRSMAWILRSEIDEILARGKAFSGDSIETGLFYLADFAPEPRRQDFSDTVREIHRSRSDLRLLEQAVQQLKDYPSRGPVYYEILYHQYLSPRPLGEVAMCNALHVERSTFYARKKEAIALLGLSLFTALRHPEIEQHSPHL